MRMKRGELQKRLEKGVDISGILVDIKLAADQGALGVTYDREIGNLVEMRLEKLGYRIIKTYGDQREPYTNILVTWRKG